MMLGIHCFLTIPDRVNIYYQITLGIQNDNTRRQHIRLLTAMSPMPNGTGLTFKSVNKNQIHYNIHKYDL